jgi:hypothetical protein
LEAESDTEFDTRRATTVPSDAHVTDTVTDEPDEPLGVNTHPVAVPVFEKSAAAMPETDSLKDNVYANVRDVDGDAGAVHVAVGATESIVTEDAETALTGPVFEALSVTEFEANRAITVPSEVHTTDTVTDEPDEPLGVNTHPVAVPVFEKSLAAIPDTASEKVNVYDNERDDEGEDGAVHVAVGGTTSATKDPFEKTPLE